ncbi:MAG TPA: rod shape-determining protein MreD [Candidatus Blautia intestinigallinarum]|nr:rod shape-determining protein MreD [Candidatus Blautia intestinigallinarum]
MKNRIILAVLILVSFLMQCTILQIFSIGSISPNLLAILCICMGFLRGKKTGMFVGFFCGLLVDLFYGSLFGFYALIYMYLGYFAGFGCQIFYDDDLKVPLCLVGVGDLVYNLAVYGLQFLLRGRLGFRVYFFRIMIPELLYTVLLTILVYKILYKINYRFMGIRTTKDSDSFWLIK